MSQPRRRRHLRLVVDNTTPAPAEPRAGVTTRPDVMVTFKRADGVPVGDECTWVTNLDWFDCADTPTELVEEVWRRETTRTFWHLPEVIGGCELEDQDPCDEDAVTWWRTPDGVWLQVCAYHDPGQEAG